MTPTLRAVIQAAKAHGCTVVSQTRNKHYKVRLQAPDGRQKTITVSSTPSCPYAAANNERLIIDFVRGTP